MYQHIKNNDSRLEPVPWGNIAAPLEAASDAVARLDERLRVSPIRAGFVARSHFLDACAALWVECELANLEDLVLHDAGMDIRTPTHELTRAHAILRARRRIAEAAPDWALSSVAIDEFWRGRMTLQSTEVAVPTRARARREDEDELELARREPLNDDLTAALAGLDAALNRSHEAPPPDYSLRLDRDPLVHDPDWDETTRLADWRAAVEATKPLPPVLAAAMALDAWTTIEPLQHIPWLGSLLTAGLLRSRRKTRHYLAGLNVGLRAIPREKRRARDPVVRLVAMLEAFQASAEAGLKDHDRWQAASLVLGQKLKGRRSNSKLPALVELVMARPIVSAAMIARDLRLTHHAALDMVADLGLREMTGRGRYRAWGVI
jgi:hypothetical protein